MTDAEMRVATAREDICRYLAACYYEPDPMFAEEGLFQSLLDAASLVDDNLAQQAQELKTAFEAASIEELLIDYTRLFLGPAGILAKPYGSVWLEESTTLMSETSLAVAELYREGGFDMDEGFRELPDHIAVELEFLYLLTFRENEACLAEDAEQLQASTALKQRFLNQHIGRWVAPFTEAVDAGTQTSFYRSLARLTRSVVSRECSTATTTT